MARFKSIQSESKIHPLWSLSIKYPEHFNEIANGVLISCNKIRSDECILCKRYSYDIDKHIIFGCIKTSHDKETLFDNICDMMDIHDFAKLWQDDDDAILSFFLGANNTNIVNTDTFVIENIRIMFVKWPNKWRRTFPLVKM